jgi:hypothetical protein
VALFSGDPLVAPVVGVGVTQSLEAGLAYLNARLVSRKQGERAATAAVFALERIAQRRNAGESLRQDGFFSADTDGRSDAEEIFEGVLLHAADAYQEAKLRYLGELYASLAFDSTVDPAYAHFLVKLADAVTYRQLGFLAALSNSEHASDIAVLDARRSAEPTGSDGAIAELVDLSDRGLVGVGQPGGNVASFRDLFGGFDPSRASVGSMALTPMGQLLRRLMGLANIPPRDQQTFLRDLARTRTSSRS